MKETIEIPGTIIEKEKDEERKILVVGKHYCPYTKSALFILKENNLPYYYIEGTDDKTDFEIENYLTDLERASHYTNLLKDSTFKNSTEYLKSLQTDLDYSTVPLIFFDGDFIGGYSELSNMLLD